MQWINENKEWFFSGLGVFLLSTLVAIIYHFFVKDKVGVKQSQKSGKGSKNFQAGNDINIGNKK